jgi:adenylosuccinate lyase
VEIRNLQKTEVLEVEESFSSNQKGSSAMPHKRNPVLSENLTGISRYIRSGVIPSLESVVLWHERDISHSSVERIMTPDITIATDFALNRLNGIIKNLKVYPKNMLKNLNMLGGLHRTHNIMLKLIEKGLKRQQAYKIVQESAMETWNNNKNFSQVLHKNKELNKKLNSKEIEKIIKDDNDLKKIDWIFKNKIK